jgi:hypothetical protein
MATLGQPRIDRAERSSGINQTIYRGFFERIHRIANLDLNDRPTAQQIIRSKGDNQRQRVSPKSRHNQYKK